MINPVSTSDPQAYAEQVQQQLAAQIDPAADANTQSSAAQDTANSASGAGVLAAQASSRTQVNPNSINDRTDIQNAQRSVISAAAREFAPNAPNAAENAAPTAQQLRQTYQPLQNQSEHQLTSVSLDVRA